MFRSPPGSARSGRRGAVARASQPRRAARPTRRGAARTRAGASSTRRRSGRRRERRGAGGHPPPAAVAASVEAQERGSEETLQADARTRTGDPFITRWLPQVRPASVALEPWVDCLGGLSVSVSLCGLGCPKVAPSMPCRRPRRCKGRLWYFNVGPILAAACNLCGCQPGSQKAHRASRVDGSVIFDRPLVSLAAT